VKILREYLYLHSDMGVEFHVPLPMILEWRAKDGEYVYKLEGVRIK